VIGVFVGIPVGLFVLIILLVMAPDMIRSARQPGLSWSGDSEWFGVRPAVEADRAAEKDTAAVEGSTAESPSTSVSAPGEERKAVGTSQPVEPGGAGGRW